MSSVLPVFGLALIDSLSAGTLVIPLLLVINQRRVVVRPLAAYFLTVCTLYFLIGVGILLGIEQLQDVLTRVVTSDPALWTQLGIGVVLLAYGILAPDPPKAESFEASQPKSLATGAIVSLAVAAVAIEAATMVPYLAAIGFLSDSALGTSARLGVLALYCLVMILPAVICITLLHIFGERIWARMERFLQWAERETKITLLWVAAIAGLWLIGNSVTGLELLG